MSNNLFNDILSASAEKHGSMVNATRELMQIFTLAALNRGGFFENAAFYGGTCQRIFYGLDRYSEDLDFSLLSKYENFSFSEYIRFIEDEFALAGIKVTVSSKRKNTDTFIQTAYLTTNELDSKIKIKIEIDTYPPPCFDTEYKLLMQPYSFYTRCYTLSSSFAGKMHALLYRSWRDRIKGRDWYDFEWYVRKGTAIDLKHFNERVHQFEKLKIVFTGESLRSFLKEKILSTDIDLAKKDILPFINNTEKLDIWDRSYFLQVADQMKIM